LLEDETVPEVPLAWYNAVIAFVLILTRLSGLLLLMPAVGGQAAPVQARALLAISLTLLLWPIVGSGTLPPVNHVADLVRLTVIEGLVGLTLGISLLVLVSGIQLAGQVIGQVSGIQMADIVDPTFEAPAPVQGKLYEMTSLALFFCLGGHRQIIAALLDSFRWLPFGGPLPLPSIHELLVTVLGSSFLLGVRLAAPIVLTLLLATAILGLVSRTVPQINVLVVGFSLNSLILLAVAMVTVGGAAWLFYEHSEWLIELLQRPGWTQSSITAGSSQ
jgi:flagellar biosynthetic protein FliR